MLRKGRWSFVAATLSLLVAVGACSDDDSGTNPSPEPPAAPTSVNAALGGDGITITWTASSGATGYIVERDVNGSGSFSQIGTPTGATLLDTNVSTGNSYQYLVKATNSAGTSGASSPSNLVVIEEELPAEATLSGTITGTRQLSADTLYFIRGTVTVEDGGVLRIPAGTELRGDVEVQPSALIVRTGGQLFSEGTQAAPVVFTSSNDVGERRRGDWGGVVLNGLSLCNFPEGECVGEGSSGDYGGDILDDNSGKIAYTRIEFAGYEVSFGNELNALTLNGVGSGTELHHIQTHYGSDDGFEWFGGTVDLKYALATGISDDSFDFSTGWQGRGQFWIAQHDPDDADNGWEVDNNEDNFDATPLTQPTVYNVSMIGKGPGGQGGTDGESTRGILLRRGTGGFYRNVLVQGYGRSCLDIDNAETQARVDAGDLEITNSILFDCASIYDTDGDIDAETIFENPDWNNRVNVDPGLVAPYDRTAPDWTIGAGGAALSGAATPPDDGFFTVTDFVGGTNDEKWWEGWFTVAQN